MTQHFALPVLFAHMHNPAAQWNATLRAQVSTIASTNVASWPGQLGLCLLVYLSAV